MHKSFTGPSLPTPTESSIFSDGETGDPQAWAGNKEAVISAHIPFLQYSCSWVGTVRIPTMPLLCVK